MPNEETMTITETAPDGTETKIEITTTKVDESESSLIEEIVDALFDPDGDSSDSTESPDLQDDVTDPTMYGLTPTEEEISTNSVEFNIGRESFPSIDIPADSIDPAMPLPNFDPVRVSETTDPTEAASTDEQETHADAARDAQKAADEFIAQGDYKAAAEARETAEAEAWQAGDDSMLGSSDSTDLENAGARQDDADYYREQQAEHIAQGDHEAAKEDAQNVAYATGDADWQAGGSDHTGQADKDVDNLDWAVWNDKNADSSVRDAEVYAAQGDFDSAERSADNADEYNASADAYAANADPAGDLYNVDPSSEVASGGAYDAGYDAGAIDTGFDAGVETAAPAYDSSGDDV